MKAGNLASGVGGVAAIYLRPFEGSVEILETLLQVRVSVQVYSCTSPNPSQLRAPCTCRGSLFSEYHEEWELQYFLRAAIYSFFFSLIHQYHKFPSDMTRIILKILKYFFGRTGHYFFKHFRNFSRDNNLLFWRHIFFE